MTLEELVERIRAREPQALAGVNPEVASLLVRATLKQLRACVEEASLLPDPPVVQMPALGSFRPPNMPGKPWGLVLARQAPQAGPAALWAKSGGKSEPVLVHPEHKFILIFSPKSACSSVVIWLFHALGLAEEARAYSDWPHNFRIDKLRHMPSQLQATQQPLSDYKILRVVRDPLERAVSSFRHALGTDYAQAQIMASLGINVREQGLSFQQFIDFLYTENLSDCDPHHRRQKHPLEDARPADVVINASRQDLFDGLNAFEHSLGMPVTNFPALRWIHELQASRVPHSVDMGPDADQLTLTRAQAQRGPWPLGLLTARAQARLKPLYAEDIRLYAR